MPQATHNMDWIGMRRCQITDFFPDLKNFNGIFGVIWGFFRHFDDMAHSDKIKLAVADN